MKISKYRDNEQPTIYLIATPIGNLSEINQRTIDTLDEVQTIYCEDTRVSAKLLNHLKIKDKKLISYHQHNEYEKLDELLNRVKVENSIALVSDAGYPLLSDPGELLVKKALSESINVVVVNGANALLPALLMSGFKTIPFTFIGFLPNKSNEALKVLKNFKDYQHTLVLYESIHRIQKTLKHIIDTFGNVDISISREITKLNEENIYGTALEILESNYDFKGELVICIDNSVDDKKETKLVDDDLLAKVEELLEQRISKKDAIKQVSKLYGVEKNYVYDLVHKK